MNRTVVSIILILVTIGAVGFAAFTYFNRSGTNTILPTPVATATPVAVDSASPSPSPSSSTTPAPLRSLSPSQPLSVPSNVETIPQGGSLFEIASSHSLSVDSLAKLNGIANADNVVAGQSVIIPDDVSDNTYTILFSLNKARQDNEDQKVKSGGSSLYSEATSAAQTDAKGIYGLAIDTPYSVTTSTSGTPNPAATATPATSTTLSNSDNNRTVTLTMAQTPSGLWYIKKMVIKVTATSQ